MPRAVEKFSRDPDATRKRILSAAKREFSQFGLGGARVDRIALRAKSNKRMLYHYFGNKEELFSRTLEDAYGAFRLAETDLRLEEDEPVTAIKRLVAFTWQYYLENPEFITLVNSENLHKAKHLKASVVMDDLNKPFLARMEKLLKRGETLGLFRSRLDSVQVLISLSGLGFHYLTNRHTGGVVYHRDLMETHALEARLRFNIESILRIICTTDTIKKLEKL